jgi:cyclic lactone autoinducer peptide
MSKKVSEVTKRVVLRNIEKEANSLCTFLFHQPKTPVTLNNYRKPKL